MEKWESGANEISLDYAQRIARVLGCKVSDLLYDAPKRDERFDEIARAYRSMSEEGKTRMLSMARWILQECPGEESPAHIEKTAL